MGEGSFPPGRDAEHRAVPEGKIRTVALVVPAFAAVRDRAEAFSRRLRLPTLVALAFAAFRSRAEAVLRRLRPPAPTAVLTGFSPSRVSVSVGSEDLSARCRSVGSKPLRLKKSCLLFKDLHPDPQWLSRFRPLNAALRIRVAQALFIHVIHKPRWNGG